MYFIHKEALYKLINEIVSALLHNFYRIEYSSAEMRICMNKLKKRFTHYFAGLMLVLGTLFISSVANAQSDITITFPTDRGIFQRDSSNKANVTVTVNFADAANVEAQVLNGDTVVSNWTPLAVDENNASLYTGTIENVPGGGWYQLKVRAKDKSTGAELATTTLERLGVGEVFITGGQSNSCNFGGKKMSALEDTVSAFNPTSDTWQHCDDSQPDISGYSTGNGGGSPWPTCGDALVKELNVPVGFITTGYGGATIAELGSIRYNAIKDALLSLKSYGYRAFLIHQGEGDSGISTTTQGQYAASLTQLIEKTRQDAGFDLPWVVANVSYTPWAAVANKTAVVNAQKSVCNNKDIFLGPNTDDMLGTLRHTDNLHFSELGLIEHGTRWAKSITEKLLTEYDVKISDSVSNGKIIFDKSKAVAGQQVTISVEPADGYYLVENSIEVNGGVVAVEDNKFTMLAEVMTVSAKFVSLPDHLLNLGAHIKNTEKINLDGYLDTGKDELKEAIAAAKMVYANPNATVEEATVATNRITGAISKLVIKPVPTPLAPTLKPTPSTPAPSTSAPAPTQTPTLPGSGNVYTKGAFKYQITSSTEKVKTVTLIRLVNKKKTSVTVPKTIVVDGYTYYVTAIGKNAFSGAKKLKAVKINSTMITSVGKNAFKNTYAKVKFKVPSKKLATYKKLFKRKGLKSSAKIIKA